MPKKYLHISVPDPWDFGTDTDPQIRPGSGPDPNPTDLDSGGQKTTDPAPYILSLLIFYTTFRQIEVFVKTFHEKLTKFRENCGTFRKSFRFRERSKKCFRPNPFEVLFVENLRGKENLDDPDFSLRLEYRAMIIPCFSSQFVLVLIIFLF
jgi:hypothetical protein